MDFTVKKYQKLLKEIKIVGYDIIPFCLFLEKSSKKCIIIRHDIDLKPKHALKFAGIQSQAGLKGSYYFRAVPESWDEGIIKKITELGHEIGYHYESLTTTDGDKEKGIADFKENLKALSELADVKTICMHGSPQSKYDSKDLWKTYDYHDYDIIGEPYFDIDFSDVFYLTDTGRRWDGYKVSVRDRIEGHQQRWEKEGLVFHSTDDIIKAAKEGRLPDRIMMTFHPQRWNDKFLPWLWELIIQNVKNVIKRIIIKVRG